MARDAACVRGEQLALFRARVLAQVRIQRVARVPVCAGIGVGDTVGRGRAAIVYICSSSMMMSLGHLIFRRCVQPVGVSVCTRTSARVVVMLLVCAAVWLCLISVCVRAARVWVWRCACACVSVSFRVCLCLYARACACACAWGCACACVCACASARVRTGQCILVCLIQCLDCHACGTPS